MRQAFALWVLLLCCGLASAQDNWIPPGQYAEPSAPRVVTPIASPEALVTPSLALDTPPLTVGASNGTLDNATGSAVQVNQPVWYEPGVTFNSVGTSLGLAPASAAVSVQSRGIELGAARFQSSYGVAQLAGKSSRRKSSRVYTNPDVAAVNDANGTIKYRSKLEHVN